MTAPVLIEKNSREVLKLSLDEFRGHRLISARVWFRGDDGELHPGKAGWALRVDKLPELIGGLRQIEAEARAVGLLDEAALDEAAA